MGNRPAGDARTVRTHHPAKAVEQAPMSSVVTWVTAAERGSLRALRAMAWPYRRFGRAALRS
jgi:hypothetical protein